MPKKRVIETVQAEDAVEETKLEEIKPEQAKARQLRLRYVGKTINHFNHAGRLYQLIPNTVYVNLPDCEQVAKLILAGELKEV